MVVLLAPVVLTHFLFFLYFVGALIGEENSGAYEGKLQCRKKKCQDINDKVHHGVVVLLF